MPQAWAWLVSRRSTDAGGSAGNEGHEDHAALVAVAVVEHARAGQAAQQGGLTRQEVAVILGVAEPTVRQWETIEVSAYRRAELLELYRRVRAQNKARARSSEDPR